MLKGIRVTLTAYTASFRVPTFVGYPLTLPVPPLSTVLGILSAAKGVWVLPEEVPWLAYRCDYEARGWDLEYIVQIERKKVHDVPQPRPSPKTYGILPREFLMRPCLTLYLPSEWEEFFRRPRYNLLLGRTQDVATVEEIVPVELKVASAGEIGGVLLPHEVVFHHALPAQIFNLPVAFTGEPVRRPLRMEIFGVIDAKRPGGFSGTTDWFMQDETTGMVVPVYRREWLMGRT